MKPADRSLPVRRELKAARKDLRALVEQRLRREVEARDPALCARLSEAAQLEAVRIMARHAFLLRRLGGPLLDAVEFLMLSDVLANRSVDYADTLGLLLSDFRHADVGPRLKTRLDTRLAELVDQATAAECK